MYSLSLDLTFHQIYMPARYPSTSPVISISDVIGFSPHQIERLDSLIKDKLFLLLDQEAIFEVACLANDYISEEIEMNPHLNRQGKSSNA